MYDMYVSTHYLQRELANDLIDAVVSVEHYFWQNQTEVYSDSLTNMGDNFIMD